MKKFFKWLLIVFIIFIGLFYGFYRYRKIVNYQLTPEKERYIRENIFGLDSENRGYSDRAKKLMQEDLKVFNNDHKMSILYDKFLKTQRLVVLSNSQQEYKERYALFGKIRNCIVAHTIYFYPNKDFKNLLNTNLNFESDEMYDYFINMHERYIRTMPYDEVYRMYNEVFTKEECNEMAKN